MNISDLLNITIPDTYTGSTQSVSTDVTVTIDNSQVLVLQPDADGHSVTLDFTQNELVVIISNDSAFSVNIKTTGEIPLKETTMLANTKIRLFALVNGEYIAIQEDSEIEEVGGGDPTLYKLVAPTPAIYDYFGSHIAMSGNGERVVVGMNSQTPLSTTIGSAFVYKYNGTIWEFEQEIKPSGIVKTDYYGSSVAITHDGTRILVGCPEKNTDAGVAYLWVWNGSSWVETQDVTPADNQAYSKYGFSCAFTSDGSKCIIGSIANQPVAQYVYLGAAYIWSWNGSAYVEEGKVYSTTVATQDKFGWSVDISDDGTKVACGAYSVNDVSGNDAGAVFTYDWSGSAWGNEQKLVASDSFQLSRFGWDVSMSGDGTRLLIGAEREAGSNLEQGAVYAFSHNGSVWSEDEKIQPVDVVDSSHFGKCVSMSTDGSRFMAGSDQDGGSVYTYDWSGSAWVEGLKYQQEAPISGSFGTDVSLNTDGTSCVVGNGTDSEFFTNQGAIFMYNNI